MNYCLNTSTLQGFKLPLAKLVEITADAGYTAIEPWIGEMETHLKSGGTLADLAKRLRDRGVAMTSAIGFAGWLEPDDAKRKIELERAKREMAMVAELGGKWIAAPAVGWVERSDLNLDTAAERYAALYDVGQAVGITPMVEVWGFSKSLTTLAQAAYVAIASKRAGAAVLADTYHLYKGLSSLQSLSLFRGSTFPVFHVNDYPATPLPATITDADRVYPGDGIAPLKEVAQTLKQIGFTGYLSLELFNKSYWANSTAEQIARTGLAKTKAAFEA